MAYLGLNLKVTKDVRYVARVTNFGISALSKKNKKYAYRAEIMYNKDIGELCVKTNDGDTM